MTNGLADCRFAPLHIPPHRRLQTAAVAFWALLLPICLFCLLICMSIPLLWGVLIPYFIWIQFDRAPDRGGRPKEWARKAFIWKYFARELHVALHGKSVTCANEQNTTLAGE